MIELSNIGKMTRGEITNQVNKIFIRTLQNDTIKLTDSTAPDDIETWDSLTRVEVIVAIETHFRIQFTSREIQSWKTIGEMIDSVEARLQQTQGAVE